MLRIWSEFLPYDEAAATEVVELLRRHAVHPIFAVRPTDDVVALGRAVRAHAGAGLEVGVWPLLSKAHGYWPNEDNHAAWEAFATGLLDALELADAMPQWVAVDLEPPIDDVTAMLRDITALPAALARFARRNLDRDAYDASVVAWTGVLERLHERGPRTLGITTPLAAHDLGERVPFWQDLLQTPWASLPFSRKGIMAYNSMISGYSRGLLSVGDARSAHDRLVARAARAFGPTVAHVSIGLTGAGVLGDEPAYFEPEPLALDAAAVRHHGVEDIGLFCLEGLLEQKDPDRWLSLVAGAEPRPVAPTPRARLLRRLGRATRTIGLLLSRS